MEPVSSKNSDDFYIETFRFCRNEAGELVKIPAGKGLHGYLVFDSEENSFYQIRLFKPGGLEELKSQRKLWDLVCQQEDSDFFPDILAVGIDDEIAYCVSTFRGGLPVERYHKNGSLPAPVACKLTADFIQRLRSQEVIPSDQYSHSYDSLWIDFRADRPIIFLGDVATRSSNNAEDENVELCLKLLQSLIRPEAKPAFAMFFESIEPGRVSLKELENWLEVYLECNPPPPDFWTKENQPRNLLDSLISQVDNFSADSKPVLLKETEKEVPAEPISPKKPRTGFKLQYLLEIGVFVFLVTFILKYMIFAGGEIENPVSTNPDFGKGMKAPEIIVPGSDLANQVKGLEIPAVVDRSRLGEVKTPGAIDSESLIDIDWSQSQDFAPEIALSPDDESFETEIENSEFPGTHFLTTNLPEQEENFVPVKHVPSGSLQVAKPTALPSASSPDIELEASNFPAGVSVPLENQWDKELAIGNVDFTKTENRGPVERASKPQSDPVTADEIRKTGEAFFLSKNATEADQQTGFAHLLQAAEQGDSVAQFLVGECLLLGKGAEKDPVRAAEFLEKAVNGGDHRAMDLLGVCHQRGWGVETNAVRAVELFQSAVDNGNIPAYYNLGARYAEGDGVPGSPSTAADLFETGADKGNAHCMLVYARCYETGFGRKKDISMARRWYRLAARAGNHEAIRWCTNKGISY